MAKYMITAGELAKSMEKGARTGVVLQDVRGTPGRWLVIGARHGAADGVTALFLHSLTDATVRGNWVMFASDEWVKVIPAPPMAEMTAFRQDSALLRRAGVTT